MLALKMLLFIYVTLILFYCLGLLCTIRIAKNRDNLAIILISGYLTSFFIYILLAIPFILNKSSLDTLLYTWLVITNFLSFISLILNKNRLFKPIIIFITELKKYRGVAACLVLLFCVQILCYVFLKADLGNDTIGQTAVTSYANNSMYQINSFTGQENLEPIHVRQAISSLPIYYAMIARLCKIHPSSMVYILEPCIILLLFYSVFYLYGQKLFIGNNKHKYIFLCFLSLLNLYGVYSDYAPTALLMKYAWQEKTIIINILFPLLIYLGWSLMDNTKSLWNWIMSLQVLIIIWALDSSYLLLGFLVVLFYPVIYGVRRLRLNEKRYSDR